MVVLNQRPSDPEKWMEVALEEARSALEHDDIPIGAVIIKDDIFLAGGHNRKEELKDPTAHAELIAIREACKKTGSWNLEGAYLFSTLEPCPMCAGAMVLARIKGLFYGVEDPKMGAISTLYQIGEDGRLNHQFEVYPGIMMEECKKLLTDFFKEKRKR